jgi:hypothetical protein
VLYAHSWGVSAFNIRDQKVRYGFTCLVPGSPGTFEMHLHMLI